MVTLGRPLMGILLALSLADRAYRLRSMDSLIFPTILLGLVVAVLALVVVEVWVVIAGVGGRGGKS